MRLRFGVSLAANATWSSPVAKPLSPFSWIHLENRAAVGSGDDVLVDLLAADALNQGQDGYWRYLAAGQRITANACGPNDAPAEALTLTNLSAVAILLLVEVGDTPIVHFSDFPTEATGGGGGGGTVQQGTAAAIAGAWPVGLTDGVHGPAAVTAADALKVDGSAVTQPVAQASPWEMELWDGSHGPVAVTAADALKVDGSAVTQPVSQGAPEALAAGVAWPMEISDAAGHGPAAVKAASTAPVATDPALVVALSPNNPASLQQNVTLQTQESTALLAANATVNGATHDTGANAGAAGAGWSRFRVFASNPQVGTINVQHSHDGATWYTTLSQPVGASSPTTVESIVCLRYVRASYTNGATAQSGIFEFDSCLVAV